MKFNFTKNSKIWAGILLAQILLFYLLSLSPKAVRTFETFFESQKHAHQRLFSWASFSVGDVFYIILALVLVYLVSNFFRKKSRGQAFKSLLIFTNVLYLVYQIFWGMMYFQEPILDQFKNENAGMEDAKRLSLKYLELCKATREKVSEDRNGVFTVKNLSEVQLEILRNQNHIPKSINQKISTGIKDFKPSLFGDILNYTGILGYYNPFTAEAQYNPALPNVQLPFTLAHESAHQMGYAREQEANFIGFLIGKDSQNPELRYSTEFFALRSLLNSIIDKDPGFVKNVVKSYSPGMKRDRDAEKKFVEEHTGFLDAFFAFTNDLFLKSNRQEGSITYSYFVELLIRYEKHEAKK